jgi:hypothetical protein
MLQRLITLAVLIGAAYWYWSGPYQDKIDPSYEAILEQNRQLMAKCIRGASYKQGATGAGTGSGRAKKECAEKYNLYEQDGHWHSYNIPRPD